MSLISEKFSRFPSVECEDLSCHDSLDQSSLDTEMQSYSWKTKDQDFVLYIFENDYSVNAFYLESRQPFLTSGMRSLLLDWIMEICSEFFLKRETCYKAISYIDRYLSFASPIKKEHFQLVGLAACYIAAKIEEIKVPNIMDFSKSAGNIYTTSDITRMERELLQALQWKTMQPTSFTICDWLMSQWDIYLFSNFGFDASNLTLKDMRGYKKHREIIQLIDASTLDIGILKFKPKIVAASACYLILFKHAKDYKYSLILNGKEFNEEFQDQYASVFMEVYLNFVSGALQVFNFDDLYACGLFMSRYMDITISYEFPSICKLGLRPEAHFQEFLGYQTYNPLCIQALHLKSRSA